MGSLRARMSLGRVITSAALALVVSVLVATSAHAGVYTVYSCHVPGGGAAPVNGWATATQGQNAAVPNSCASGGRGAFEAVLAANAKHAGGSFARWRFTTPPNTAISSFSVDRAISLGGGNNGTSGFSLGGLFSIRPFSRTKADAPDQCLTGDGCGGRSRGTFGRANLEGVGSIGFEALCSEAKDGCPSTGIGARYTAYSAAVTLLDVSDPVITSAPAGSLLEAGPRTGTHSVTVGAGDAGGGVFGAALEVDGNVVATAPFPGDGRCAVPYVFTVPCRASATTTLSLDTAGLTDGSHRARVIVYDATGTNSAASAPVDITTANGVTGAPVGTSVSARPYGLLHGYARYGRRVLYRGRLVAADGTGIPGATMAVFARTLTLGARYGGRGTVTSDAQGYFAYTSPAGPGRRVRFAYPATGQPGGAGIVASARAFKVRAPVGLSVSPRRVGLRGSVVFSLHLRGGYIPKAGKPVALQAFTDRGWRTFAIARVSARSGRARYRYRFTRTLRRSRYTFRAVSFADGAYAYAAGRSGHRSVVVG